MYREMTRGAMEGKVPVGRENKSGTVENTDNDPLATAFRKLFDNVASYVLGELQVTGAEYELLEKMNVRASAEYKNYGDFASGLSVFINRLKIKSADLGDLLKHVDEIEQHVAKLEKVVSALDTCTKSLEDRLRPPDKLR